MPLCITPEAMPQRPTKKQRSPTGISMSQDPANRMRMQNPNLGEGERKDGRSGGDAKYHPVLNQGENSRRYK